MAIKQNFPDIKPSLNLDFANTKSLDPRVDFDRSSTATYYDGQGILRTAALNEPRFDHDPVTGESKGLLIEDQRTNLVTYSEDFTQWSASGNNTGSAPVVSPNSAVAPNGQKTADRVVFDLNGGTTSSDRSKLKTANSISFTGGILHTFTLWMKSATNNEYDIEINIAFRSTVVRVSPEWQRFIFVSDGGYTGNSLASIRTFGDTSSNFADIYIWGAQVEEGSFPTSYIKTEASQVTRVADSAVLANDNVYRPDRFTAISQPFGVSSVSAQSERIANNETIERISVYPGYLPQNQINSVANVDESWAWRVTGDTFSLPAFSSDGTVEVDWGDGTVETLTTAAHTFTNAGPHTINFRLVSGTYFEPRLVSSPERDNLIAVGPTPVGMEISCNSAFERCANLSSFDATLKTNGTNLRSAWEQCSSLTSFPQIDTSNATDFSRAWIRCSSLTSFPQIDTSSATRLDTAWYECSSLTSFPQIDTSSATDFELAWTRCSSLTSFPQIDTSNATNLRNAWEDCSSLTSFPQINTSNVTDLHSAWEGCSSLTSFPQIDTSSATDFSFAWIRCFSLTSFPQIDTSNATNLSFAWYECSSLTSFPQIDTSNVTDFSRAWDGCSSLTEFPQIDTSNATNLSFAWEDCSSLTSFPQIDTSNVTDLHSAWERCSSLTEFPQIDTSNATNLRNAWEGCSSLTSFPQIDTSSATDFSFAWIRCFSLTSFPQIDTSNATNLSFAWYECSSLTEFPANVFDGWLGTPANGVFDRTWEGCSSLTSTSVENILVSIDTSGQSAPASGVDIRIDYDGSGLTAATNTAITNLKSRGWTVTINGVAQ